MPRGIDPLLEVAALTSFQKGLAELESKQEVTKVVSLVKIAKT